jgi:polar amino acid transport system substrate-binding protein
MSQAGHAKETGTQPARRALCWVAIGLLAGACVPVPEVAAEPEGPFRVGWSLEPPYAFLDASGRVTGESPEAMRVVLDALGIENVRWSRMEFDELIPALEQGRVDAVASGLYSSPSRRDRVRFSLPTVCTRPALLVRGDLEHPPLGLGELALEGAGRIAFLVGGVEEEALDVLDVPRDRRLGVYDVTTGVAALQTGEAEAFAVSLPTARRAVEAPAGQGLAVVGPYEPGPSIEPLLVNCSALLFRAEDEVLARRADCVLAGFAGSPEHRELLDRFGFDESMLPRHELSGDPAASARTDATTPPVASGCQGSVNVPVR